MQLRGAEKYDLKKLPELEKHVEQQIASNTFDLDANLALLRFYQFQPTAVKPALLAKVLLKALMQLPGQDFKVCVHLVPERLQADGPVAQALNLAGLVETTEFGKFWAACAGEAKDLVASVPGFAEAMRSFILHVASITFQRVSRATLGEYLKLDSAALDALVADKVSTAGWSVSGAVVCLPKNGYNQPVTKRAQDLIKFDQISSVLKSITVGM